MSPKDQVFIAIFVALGGFSFSGLSLIMKFEKAWEGYLMFALIMLWMVALLCIVNNAYKHAEIVDDNPDNLG